MCKASLRHDKYSLLLPLFVLLSFLIANTMTAGEDAGRLKWEYAAVVFIESGKTIAEDRYGDVILERMTGKDDADVIQAAVEAAGPAGEIKVCRGRYVLNESVQIYNNIKFSGEGRGTVLIPPLNDYALKVEKTDKEFFTRPFHAQEGDPLYAVIIRDIAIDGKRGDQAHSGKGIFLHGFWSSVFENLWIQNTGNAMTLQKVSESDFANIYLINTGDEDKKEAGLSIRGGNNIHFSGLYVIYQNYIGLDMLRGKLVFITQSMFHGWLPRLGGPPKYPLIQIKDLNEDKKNEGRFKSDFVIENSRITVGGGEAAVVTIINSPVTLRQCVAAAGYANTVVSASGNARANLADNSFYSLNPLPAGEYVLYAEDSEVIFKNNVISNLNLQVCLKGVRNSIIADNRFDTDSDKPAIFIGSSEGQNSRNILVSGNIFFKSDQDSAVAVEKQSAGNIVIRDNMLGAE
jgi:hypothetical protein